MCCVEWSSHSKKLCISYRFFALLVMFAPTCPQRGVKQGRVRMSCMTIAVVSVLSVAVPARQPDMLRHDRREASD